MAGAGSRFIKAGYTMPKPMIDVMGEPMIVKALKHLPMADKYIFVAQEDHLKAGLEAILKSIHSHLYIPYRSITIIPIKSLTAGAACTCLLADRDISDEPLMIANCDQVSIFSSMDFKEAAKGVDGLICTFKSDSPAFSYVNLDSQGYVTHAVEKTVLDSKLATCGIYYWDNGRDFVHAARQMVRNGQMATVNGEFYVCPVYNYNIKAGHSIRTFDVKEHYSLGTPEELQTYLDIHQCK